MKITVGGVLYEIGIDENGAHYAKTYIEKHKIWVYLEFSQNEGENGFDTVIDMLKREYLKKAVE